MNTSDKIDRRQAMQLMAMSALTPMIVPDDTITDPARRLHITRGSGAKAKLGGVELQFKLSKNQTAGQLGCDESTLLPGYLGAPPHLHKTFDEICYVLEGTIHIMVGEQVDVVNQGDWHLRPRGVVHTFWNSSKEPARFINIYTPGGHEEYLQDISNLLSKGKPSPKDFALLESKHDIVYAFDQLPGILQKYKLIL